MGAYTAHDTEAAAWAGAQEAIERVGLGAGQDAVAGSLTNKELRLLELARALASKPNLVLMDEPLAGLGSSETQEIIALARALPAAGVTVVIIEHTMHAMISTVDRFVVLDHGQLLTEGSPAAVTANRQSCATPPSAHIGTPSASASERLSASTRHGTKREGGPRTRALR